MSMTTLEGILSVEGYCIKNSTQERKAPHSWGEMKWLSYSRAWIRRCRKCGAIEVWRGNDTIYYEAGSLLIFHHKHEFTENPEAAAKFLRAALRELEELEWEEYSSRKKNTRESENT